MSIRAGNLGTAIVAKSWATSTAVHLVVFAALVGYSRNAAEPPQLAARFGQTALMLTAADPNPGSPDEEFPLAVPTPVLVEPSEAPAPQPVPTTPTTEVSEVSDVALDVPRVEVATDEMRTVPTPPPPSEEQPIEDSAEPKPSAPAPEATDQAQAEAPQGDDTPTSSAPSPGRMGNDQPTDPGFDSNPPILYPPTALRDGIEGTVLLRIRIATSGRVAEVTLVKSSGSSVLDEAAIEAVRTWQGRPAQIGGYAVEASALLPVVFRLQ